jgi:hypothetical protein
MPMVAWYVLSKVSYMNLDKVVNVCSDGVVSYIPRNQGRLSDGLVPQQDYLCPLEWRRREVGGRRRGGCGHGRIPERGVQGRRWCLQDWRYPSEAR